MSFWRLYYHLVWATKHREPLINPTVETDLHNYLSLKCEDNEGRAYCINGMTDHVHLIVTVPPTIALSQFIKNLKGSSSHFMNHSYQQHFSWQERYSAFTISERNLEQAIGYVKHQKLHHQSGTTYTVLEPTPD